MFYRNRSLSWSGARAPSGAVPEGGAMRPPGGTGRNVSEGRIPPRGIPAKPEGGIRTPTKKDSRKAVFFCRGTVTRTRDPLLPKQVR